MSFKLAQITDLHMGPMIPFGPRYWSAKRLLGVINWHRGRKNAHLVAVLEQIVTDMMAQSPDHIAVTGDLTNVGLPDEHIAALGWLRALAPPDRVSVIPGNHDIYTSLGGDEGAMRWRDYMTGESWPGGGQTGDADTTPSSDRGHHKRDRGRSNDAFPYLRRMGPIALIGLNSAVPTKPFVAAGELGEQQRDRLSNLLELTGKEDLARVIIIHHPPLPGQAGKMRGLRDAAQLGDILTEHGAELVLHGHNHRNLFRWHPRRNNSENADPGVGGLPATPVIGAPSASMARHHHGEPLARYNIYNFTNGGRDATIELIGRGLAEPGGNIVELERRVLDSRDNAKVAASYP